MRLENILSNDSSIRRLTGKIRAAVGFVLIVAVLYYIARHVIEIDLNIIPNLDIGRLTIASILYVLFCLLTFTIFHYIMREIKFFDIEIFDSMWVFFASLQGKYLPGKFGNLLLKYKFLRERDIGLKNIMSVFLLEQGVALLTGMLVAGIIFSVRSYLPGYPETENLRVVFFYLFLSIAGLASALFYKGFPSVSKYLKTAIFYLVGWMMFTSAVSFFIYSAGNTLNINYARSLEFSMLYTISVIVGFLSLVSPAGLGIREAVFSFLISNRVGDPNLLFVGIMIRAWTTVAELALTAFSYLAFKKFGGNSE